MAGGGGGQWTGWVSCGAACGTVGVGGWFTPTRRSLDGPDIFTCVVCPEMTDRFVDWWCEIRGVI